jgi:hypothetical protein
MSSIARQPWIHSAVVDTSFILGPALIASLIAFMIMMTGHARAEVSLGAWALLVIGIDVAHVYSTLYRTYLDPIERRELSGWLVATPVGTWVVGVLFYTWSAALFWSVLAYTAVFHFVRQQYGFLMLYGRSERSLPRWCRQIDQLAIYGATLFPLLYWHTHLPRPFVWFMDGDFVALPVWLWRFALPLYVTLWIAYVAKELWLLHRTGQANLPRNVLVLGTAISWYVGIVWASGDLVFTLTNVVAHGIPYIALTCIFARRRDQRRQSPRSLFVLRWLPLALSLLVALAFVEEGLWDGLIWREHSVLFPGFSSLPHLEGVTVLSLVVPLLSVPQMTHYVIDGVIWRLRTHPQWRTTLFWRGITAGAPQ